MLFDSGCAVCGERRGPVCVTCHQSLQHHQGPTPLVGLDNCRVQYVLDEPLRALVVALKYRRQRRLADWFAGVAVDLVPRAADAMCWVPATPERRRTRGFDQAEELAKAFSRRTGVPARRLLLRRRSDYRQTGQDRAGRLRGPALAATASSPGFVVLVDDVVTTGSSMRTAAETLRGAGAHRVVGVALAATPRRRKVSLRGEEDWV